MTCHMLIWQDLAHLGAALRGTALITLGATIALQVLDYVLQGSGAVGFLRELVGQGELML